MLKKIIQLILISLFLFGCVSVTVSRVTYKKSLIEKRNDILTNGKLSDYTKTTMQLIGENSRKCEENPIYCIQKLNESQQISKDKLYSALSELWMQQSVLISENYVNKKNNLQVPALIKSVRYAYAYLFLSDESINDRPLEDRQNQIRDYYNYGTQQLSIIFYKILQTNFSADTYTIKFDKFNISFDFNNIQNNIIQKYYDIIPAISLSFKGIKNIYFRDGIGSEFIISPDNTELNNIRYKENYQYMVINSITTIIDFPHINPQNINTTYDLTIKFYDAYNVGNIKLHNTKIKLAANFTASYGWWLSKSNFSSEPYLAFLKKFSNKFTQPKLYMMQPFNPNKRIIILLHGLFSSPEAWINLANDIMGSDNLRNNYQIWQIYYPTNLPILINTFNIRNFINAELNKVDSKRKTLATQKIVLIGHSLGGVITRLLVSDYTLNDLKDFLSKYKIPNSQKQLIIDKITPYIVIKPLKGVNRVIFLATPHRGTKIKDGTFLQFISRKIVSIPNNVYSIIQNSLIQIGQSIFVNNTKDFANMNSIDGLNKKDPLMGLFYNKISIGSGIKYHSIIADNTPKKPLEESNDGYVAWTSSHLDQAISELIVHSSHSVQNSTEAITEIRRILELNLQEDK